MRTLNIRKSIVGISLLALLLACTTDKQLVVSRIIDGDTIEITFPDGSTEKLDLAHIDAPERAQPMGRQATLYLQKNLLKQVVSFDEYDRILLRGKPVALLMLQQGLAWDASEKAPFDVQLAYQNAHHQAQESGVGLWGLEHALRVPPWQWRQDATQLSEYSRAKQHRRTNKDSAQKPKGQ
ncbi:MAG: thermonuclease family protein [Aestuariibacter sp.]